MTDLLEVNGVTKRFGGLTAVKNASFTLKKGEFTGILGPNGAGKTTLFNILTGFMQPTTGTHPLQRRTACENLPPTRWSTAAWPAPSSSPAPSSA